jgi:hypothetical protein
VIILTPVAGLAAYTLLMEWMLQVVDEIDDAVGALRFGWSGLLAEIGVLLLVVLGIAAEVAGPRLGAEPALLGAGALTANIAAFLKSRRDRRA